MSARKDNQYSSANLLLESSASVFALTAQLKSFTDEASLTKFRESIVSAFDHMERMSFEREIGTSVIQNAKYALAAFVDESVLGSECHGRINWMSHPLQLQFFGDHLAGENFFEKLKIIRQGGEQNIDLLELYYTCLQMGFEGMYRMQGLEALMALQVDLRSQIDGYRGVTDPKLSPDGVPKGNIIATMSRNVPYWVIGVVTLGMLFFNYAGYSVLLSKKVATSIAKIESDYTRISAYTPIQTNNVTEVSR